MKTVVPRIYIAIASCMMALFTGCAFNKPGGNVFSLQVPSEPNKALVYFYRPLGESTGYDRTYFLAVNQRKVVNLLHGGYFPYETEAGTLTLLCDVNMTGLMLLPDMLVDDIVASSVSAGKLDLQVEAGKTYYVRMHPEKGFYHFKPRLDLMSLEQGAREIADCRLITNPK